MIIEFPITREMRALQYEQSRMSLVQCRDIYGDAFPMMFPAARLFDRVKWNGPAPHNAHGPAPHHPRTGSGRIF
jgi:hypothetical protein